MHPVHSQCIQCFFMLAPFGIRCFVHLSVKATYRCNSVSIFCRILSAVNPEVWIRLHCHRCIARMPHRSRRTDWNPSSDPYKIKTFYRVIEDSESQQPNLHSHACRCVINKNYNKIKFQMREPINTGVIKMIKTCVRLHQLKHLPKQLRRIKSMYNDS